MWILPGTQLVFQSALVDCLECAGSRLFTARVYRNKEVLSIQVFMADSGAALPEATVYSVGRDHKIYKQALSFSEQFPKSDSGSAITVRWELFCIVRLPRYWFLSSPLLDAEHFPLTKTCSPR